MLKVIDSEQSSEKKINHQIFDEGVEMKNMLLLVAMFACFYSEKVDTMSVQNSKICRQSPELSIPKKLLRKESIKGRAISNGSRKIRLEINKNPSSSIETLAAEQLLCLKHSNSSLISNNAEDISKLRSVFLSYVGNLLKLRRNEAMLHQKISKRREELRIWKKELKELRDYIKKTQQKKKSSFLILNQAKNLKKQ